MQGCTCALVLVLVLWWWWWLWRWLRNDRAAGEEVCETVPCTCACTPQVCPGLAGRRRCPQYTDSITGAQRPGLSGGGVKAGGMWVSVVVRARGRGRPNRNRRCQNGPNVTVTTVNCGGLYGSLCCEGRAGRVAPSCARWFVGVTPRNSPRCPCRTPLCEVLSLLRKHGTYLPPGPGRDPSGMRYPGHRPT